MSIPRYKLYIYNYFDILIEQKRFDNLGEIKDLFENYEKYYDCWCEVIDFIDLKNCKRVLAGAFDNIFLDKLNNII